MKSFGFFIFMLAPAVAFAADDSIVVTAERRPQAATEVPTAISVVGGDELALSAADHIAESLSRAPGVNLHRGSGAEHLTAIRSPVLTGGAGAGSFLFLENGVPLRSPGFANINGLFDAHDEIAARIEIVRGPSGALYGANAIHGVVNVITPTPAEAPQLLLEAFGDTQDRYKWKGIFSEERGDQAFLIGASAVSESGYRDDASLDQQKLTLRHVYDPGGSLWVDTIFSFDNLEQETAGFIFGETALNDRALRRENEFPQAFRDAKSARLQSTILIENSDQSSWRLTPFARWNDMVFPQHFLPGNALEENGHWSAGFQTAYYRDSGDWSFVAGVDGEYTRGSLTEFQAERSVFSFVQGLHYDYDVRALHGSGFAQAKYAISSATTLTGAIRVDATDYAYDNHAPDGSVGRFLRVPDRNDGFVTASPKISLRHEFSDDLSAYAAYARGARPPQTTDLYRLQTGQTGPGARPEKIDSVEVGLRVAAGERAKISLAGFYMDKRNFFFRDADGLNVPDGKTRHLGVEADIVIALHERATLSSALTYAAHTYRFDRPTGNAAESISSGDDVDTAPRFIGNTRLTLRPVDGMRFEAEWRRIGAYYTDAANDHRYDGHHLVNLRAEAAVTDYLSAYLTLRNVTNTLYAERADFAFGEDRYFPGETRTLGFGLRLSRE